MHADGQAGEPEVDPRDRSVGAAASSSASRVLSSSSGVDDLNGKSRKASTRQKASAMMRRTRLSGAAGVSRA